MSDKEKSEFVLEGDLTSDLNNMEDIFSATWEPLYRFIYYKVQNREEAEDITQETYIKALNHFRRNNARIERKLSFLKAVSLNVLRDKWRLSKRQGKDINLDDINPEEIAIEDSAETTTQTALIQKALSRLTEDQRMVVDLRIIKGYSTAEAAKIMNKKEGAIRVLQYRALQHLERLLDDEFS